MKSRRTHSRSSRGQFDSTWTDSPIGYQALRRAGWEFDHYDQNVKAHYRRQSIKEIDTNFYAPYYEVVPKREALGRLET